MKRIITLLLTLAMTFSLAMPAQAASTKASTMRLMDTVGTATVENTAGKNLSIKDNMRLYNGYEVATKDASYAYISLDSSKAVKLDASSAVKVNQSGKKLELDVTTGELMFNVPVALKSDESLNIRTSTMVTGIRGTAGWVNALDRYTTRVAVLEGAVTINSQDPFTGADRAVTITGGQIATIIRHERAMAIQQQLIDDGVIIEDNIIAELTKPGQVVEELQESGVPGFVATEVAANEDLQDRMNEESPLSVEEISKDAQKRQKDDERAAAQQKVVIEEKLNTVGSSQPGLPFTEPEVIVQTNTVTNTVTNTETEYVSAVLVNPTNAQVETALNNIDTVVIAEVDRLFDLTSLELSEEDTVYLLDGEYTVDENEEWDIDCGTLICAAGVQIINKGTITTSTGTLTIDVGAELINRGKIYVFGGSGTSSSLILNGNLQNSSDIMIGYGNTSGQMLIEDRGELFNYNIEENEGTWFKAGNIIIEGENRPLPAMLTEYSEQTSPQNILINQGTIYNYAEFVNAGILKNSGDLCNGLAYEDPPEYGLYEDDLEDSFISYSGRIFNYGQTDTSGRLLNDCSFYNRGGTIVATGTDNCAFENREIGSLYMESGTISASGNCCALRFSGGEIRTTSGEVVYTGSGNGCALSVSLNDGYSYMSSVIAKAPTGSLHNLIGARADCIRDESCSYNDYTGQPVSFNAISLYNYYAEYEDSDPYFKARCFPYSNKTVTGDYTTYTISFAEWCSHEGGPC